jgi:hypothetical protein
MMASSWLTAYFTLLYMQESTQADSALKLAASSSFFWLLAQVEPWKYIIRSTPAPRATEAS